MNEKMLEELSCKLTKKLDNTDAYESWLTIQKYIDIMKQENKELQKKLEDKEKLQKHFMEWLENKLDAIKNILDTEDDEDKIYFTLIRKDAVEESLSKYKEISSEIKEC